MKYSDKKDVVVLAGCEPLSVLSLCRIACLQGARTYVVCVGNGWGAKLSKSSRVYKAFDTSLGDLDAFWERFFQENSFEQKPILYITNDEDCRRVDTKRSFYEENFSLCLPSSYVIQSFTDKGKASVEAVRWGLDVPKTIGLESESDIDAVCRDFAFPVIVKPLSSHDGKLAGFKMKVLEDEAALRSFVNPRLNFDARLQCQEYIPGEDNDYVFYQFYRDERGHVLACMGEKTMQTRGTMTVGTTRYNAELDALCRDFLAKIDYVGIGGIEFKYYQGRYYFIEMSTRTEGFLSVSDMAGVSLASISYQAMNGMMTDFTKKQKEGVRYIVCKQYLYQIYKQQGLISMMKHFICAVFSSKAYFAGAFLDFCFALKTDLKIIK